VIPAPVNARRPGVADALKRLQDEAGRAQVVVNPWEATPSFIDTNSGAPAGTDLPTTAVRWASAHAGLFGLSDLAHSLQVTRVVIEGTGQAHVYLNQVFHGVPVYQGSLSVHLNSGHRVVRQVVNGLRPDVTVPDTHSNLDANAALAAARKALPADQVVEPPLLTVFSTDVERLVNMAARSVSRAERSCPTPAGGG
jgi:Zn-dependent metalloprotease